jgi:hypothetical protein
MHDMDNSSDIANLFKHFDGDPAGYQEFMLSSDALHARSRWPLIAAIDPAIVAQPAPVTREPRISVLTQDSTAAMQSALPDEAVHASAEKPLSKAQFVAPQAKVFSAASIRRGRDAASIPRNSENAKPPAMQQGSPLEALFSPVADTAIAPPSIAETPKKRRVRKPAKSEANSVPDTETSPQPALAHETADISAETSADEARFVAPKPKVLSAGATRRGRTPADFDNDAKDTDHSGPSGAPDQAVDEDADRRASSNGASRSHSTETPPFLFKRL